MKLRIPALAAALLGAAAASAAGLPPDTLAVVNGEPVTGLALKADFKKRHGGHEKFLGGEKEVRSFLQIVIDDRLLIQEAYRLELQDDPDIRRAAAEFEDRRLGDYFVKLEIEEQSRVSDDEIRTAWERNFLEAVSARQIVLDDNGEAEWVYRELLDGVDFDLLARACSIAPSWRYGGRLPPIVWGSMDPLWESTVFSLSPGEIATPFRNADGWQVVQLVVRTPTPPPGFEESRPRIEGILKKRKFDRRREEVSARLTSKYHARRTLGDLGPEAFARVLAAEENVPVEVWDGGELRIREFVAGLDRAGFDRLPAGRFRDRLDDDLRAAVDSRLALKEARGRRLDRAPEVARDEKAYREDRMEGTLYAEHILKGIDVSDAEVAEEFNRHASEMVEPEKRRVAHIVVASREDAEAALRRLHAGESFEDLVRALSTDAPSVKENGDLGWITKNAVSKEFEPVLALQPGEVSEPLRSRFGYHLVKVTEVVPERRLTFEASRDGLRKKILLRKQQEKRKMWVDKLRAAASIELVEKGIEAFVRANAYSLPDDTSPKNAKGKRP